MTGWTDGEPELGVDGPAVLCEGLLVLVEQEPDRPAVQVEPIDDPLQPVGHGSVVPVEHEGSAPRSG